MPSPNLFPGQKYGFKDFERQFPDERACMEWMVEHFFPHGIHCVKCGEVRPRHLLKSRPKVVCCDYCGAHTHPIAGTIFHNSSTSLRTWFHAIFLMSQTRCGISAMQLLRETGVTYKTAWRMFNRIRGILGENVTGWKARSKRTKRISAASVAAPRTGEATARRWWRGWFSVAGAFTPMWPGAKKATS